MNCKNCRNSCASKFDLTGSKKIVLVGNPNVGKSVFFNQLTGFYVEVSNYPGTTVDVSRAEMHFGEVIDTPGVYSIGNDNEEEIVAKSIILEADIIINVVSALSLERDLFLTQQLIDMGFPLIVALNQFDEAQARGTKININLLESMIGTRVIPTIATKNQGIDEVKNIITRSQIIQQSQDSYYIHDILRPANHLLDEKIEMPRQERTAKVLEIEANPETKKNIYQKRIERINEIVENVVAQSNKPFNLSTFVGHKLLNPFIGTIVAAFILFLLYQLIGVYISGNVVNFLEKGIFLKYYVPAVTDFIYKLIPNNYLNQVLAGEFGMLTMTVQYIIGILMPLVISFYLFMSALEDSGYLPRLAVLTDRILSKIGLNGKAVIPIILGFGCITMATITTRILGSNRERTIASTILGLAIPCSAQLGLIISILAFAGGLKAWILYLITIFCTLVIIGTVLNKLLPGESSHLLIDLPPMRLPVIKNIINKTFYKTKHFLLEATPLFFLGAFLVTNLKLTGLLDLIEKALSPITVSLLNLPAQTASIFIMGLIRRDFGAAGLAKMSGIGGEAILSSDQILVSLVVITLFVPCIASVIVMYKERGWKEASFIWLGSWVIAFLVGGILTSVLRIFS